MKDNLDKNFNKLKDDILRNNKMLYCMYDRSCMETCMCWGLEIDNGWLNIVDEMSMALEGLNYIFYPKFRVRVQMDQLKSKYGTLHAYYSVVADPPKWMCIWQKMVQKAFDKISKLDFKRVKVLDRDAYNEVVEEELATREEFEKEKIASKNCSNVDVFERDGKFIKKATYSHFRKTHMEATKHRFLWWLLDRRHYVANWPVNFFNVEPTYVQRCVSNLIEEKARAIVHKAEKDCYGVCERCGRSISDESSYSPRCTTCGWTSYLCQSCADKTGSHYMMGSSIWQDGKEIMTKKEYTAYKAKIEERFRGHLGKKHHIL